MRRLIGAFCLLIPVSGCSTLTLVQQAPEGCKSLGVVEVSTLCRPSSGSAATDLEMIAGCDDTVFNRLKAAARKRGANSLQVIGAGRGEVYSCP
jgi:hypothetical protein